VEKCNINTDLLLFKIFHIHKIICNKANKYLSKDGLAIQVEQIPVLMVIYYTGLQSQQEIADELLRDKSSVLRTVSWLEKAGYIIVEPDTTDKRKKLLKLTKQGQQLAEKIAEETSGMDDKMFSNLSKAEKLILTELLDKVTHHINTQE
jgi:DNA-binding MarR family transcriptional regulator